MKTGKDGTKYETVYLIDAKTSDPIEWRVTREGKDATLRFAAYEELPSTPENLALLSLAEQHSGAVLDTNQQDFEEATSRLYPNN